MKKLLLLLISLLGIFSACEREPVTPIPPYPGEDSTICLYGIRTAVYEPKAAAEDAILDEEQWEMDATKKNVTVDIP